MNRIIEASMKLLQRLLCDLIEQAGRESGFVGAQHLNTNVQIRVSYSKTNKKARHTCKLLRSTVPKSNVQLPNKFTSNALCARLIEVTTRR
jgi:hypothetical protein